MRERAVPAKAVRLWYSWKSKQKWCSDYYILSWCFHAMKGGESHSRNGHLEMDFGWNEIFNVRPPVHFIQLTLAMSFPTRNFTAFSFFRCLILTSIQYLQQKHTWCNICIYKGTLLKRFWQMLLVVHCKSFFGWACLIATQGALGGQVGSSPVHPPIFSFWVWVVLPPYLWWYFLMGEALLHNSVVLNIESLVRRTTIRGNVCLYISVFHLSEGRERDDRGQEQLRLVGVC